VAVDVDDSAGLVDAARRGSRAAFSSLYARFARTVHGILIARVPRADVDDLVQDVFVRAMEQIETLRDNGAFGAWLATIARNRAADHLRHSPRTTELPPDLASNLGASDETMLVLAHIRSLPDAYRETLTLRLIEGMTGPEIAARTGLTEGSVRVNLHRGMKQLRARLERKRA
jgi:RNA polymerase sigma-70 factor (ECF subfamily)